MNIVIMDPLCTKLWQKRAERFGLPMARTLITEEVTISVPATVRLRDRDADGFATYRYEAEGRVAGYRHVAYGETPNQAVANLRDWIVNQQRPEAS